MNGIFEAFQRNAGMTMKQFQWATLAAYLVAQKIV